MKEFEDSLVFSEKHGHGTVLSQVPCRGSVSKFLLTIKFESRPDEIALYDDEIRIVRQS